jgi:hypothetical protein
LVISALSKYRPLADYLNAQKADSVTLKFSQVEAILGFDLPSSCEYAAWWSNNPTNSVMTRVWMDAGWRTKNVRLKDREVTFYRSAEERDGTSDEQVVRLADLPPLARTVLSVLAKRSGRSVAEEARSVLEDALK